MSEFDKLIQEIEDEQASLAKAMSADDDYEDEDKKAASGKDGDEDDTGAADEDGDGKGGEEEEEEENEYMGKAFDVTLEDGTKVSAYDGSAAVKQLLEQNQRIAKAHQETVRMLKSMSEQNGRLSEEMDRVQKSLEAIGNQSRGRRSTVTMPAAPPAKEENEVTPKEFMAKAMDAYRGGRLTSEELTIAEASIGAAGRTIPDNIVRAVMGA